MTEIFKAAIERGASDIHIKSGDVVRVRINGLLLPLTQQRVSHEQVQKLAERFIPNDEDRANIAAITDYDCSWGLPGLGRFRVNLLKQRGSFSIIMRVVPIEIPTVDGLGLPPVLKRIAEHERGMVLVTGVTGSGKSSTMAAMIDHINQNVPKHVVTLENPIEFLHRDNKASITQRDIGTDTESFVVGLRAALRQDPDVILIGEMRDKITIDTGMKAAETGHLVISTVHTKNSVQTLTRLMAVFEPAEQEIIRMRLAENLVAIVSQRLVPTKDGKGRIAACEIMHVTGTIRDCILEPTRTHEIADLIASGRSQYQSQTFDQHLMDMVNDDLVEFEVAKANANNPNDFDLSMRGFGGSAPSAEAGNDYSDSGSSLFGD